MIQPSWEIELRLDLLENQEFLEKADYQDLPELQVFLDYLVLLVQFPI